MHRRLAHGEGCLSLTLAASAAVLLARLVRLRFNVAGQARALSFVGCPTVQPLSASCAHMSAAGTHYAPWARTRAFQFLLTGEKGKIEVGQ